MRRKWEDGGWSGLAEVFFWGGDCSWGKLLGVLHAGQQVYLKAIYLKPFYLIFKSSKKKLLQSDLKNLNVLFPWNKKKEQIVAVESETKIWM